MGCDSVIELSLIGLYGILYFYEFLLLALMFRVMFQDVNFQPITNCYCTMFLINCGGGDLYILIFCWGK